MIDDKRNRLLQVIFILTVILLFCFGCWERQDINLLRPEIPHYTLSGYTVDIDDSTLILPNTPISITSVQMLYDITFDPITLESNSSGHFQIDTVYPGNYIISAKRGGYNVVSENITIYHVDKIYNINLPKPLLSDLSYEIGLSNPGGYNPIFNWAGSNLWLLGVYKSEGWPDIPLKDVIFRCFLNSGIFGWDAWYLNSKPLAYSSEYANGKFYIYSGYLTILNDYDLTIVNSYDINDPFNSMTWDGSGFWSTFGHSLQYRGPNLVAIEDSWEVDSGNLGPLTKSGDYFWSYDLDRDLILKIDKEGIIHKSYRPIYYDTGDWVNVHDMDFEYAGKLWVSDKLQKRLYIFQVE